MSEEPFPAARTSWIELRVRCEVPGIVNLSGCDEFVAVANLSTENDRTRVNEVR